MFLPPVLLFFHLSWKRTGLFAWKPLVSTECKSVWSYNLWNISLTANQTSGHSSHVFPSPPAWHPSIISLVGMPGSCHHHHGNVSVLPLAITMAMGVSPSNHQHGPNVSLLTKITMAICACPNAELSVGMCVSVSEIGKKKRKRK